MVPTVVPTSLHDDSAPESTPTADPDLALIASAWAQLPEVIKTGILAMVQAAGGHDV